MKCFLGISNFLEEISSLSPSIVFLYFFALITEEGFLISPYYTILLAKSLQSCVTLCDPLETVVLQVPLSMGFSRQEY